MNFSSPSLKSEFYYSVSFLPQRHYFDRLYVLLQEYGCCLVVPWMRLLGDAEAEKLKRS